MYLSRSSKEDHNSRSSSSVFVVCVLAPAYTSLCRDLKYSPKVRYMSEKYFNVYVVNTHISVYWHARCDCNLWKAFWFYCVFWVYSYIIIDHTCLNSCISTKLSLFVFVINTEMSKCQMWLQVVERPLI